MASVLRSISRPSLSLSQHPVISLKHPHIGTSNGTRWVSLLRSNGIPVHALARRNWSSANAAPSFALTSTSGLRNGSFGYRLRSRQKFASSTRQLISHRCYSEFRNRPDQTGDWEKWNTKTGLAALVMIAGAIYYALHLERVPQTGRWRFMGVPQKWEATLAKEEYAAFLEEFRGRILPPSHPITQQIRTVVSAILEANGLGILASTSVANPSQKDIDVQNVDSDIWDPDSRRAELDFISEDASMSASPDGDTLREWNLIVVDDDSIVNAMAGNGNVIVFTGILPIAHDMDGLAAVLSHEIAHVVARHVSEKLSELLIMNGILYLLPLFGLDVGYGPILMKYLYHLPNSRVIELEGASLIILCISRLTFLTLWNLTLIQPTKLVFNSPRVHVLTRKGLSQCKRAWQISNAAAAGLISVSWRHPTGSTRIKLLTNALPEAYALRAASSACAHLEDDFDAFRAAASKVRDEQDREMSE